MGKLTHYILYIYISSLHCKIKLISQVLPHMAIKKQNREKMRVLVFLGSHNI